MMILVSEKDILGDVHNEEIINYFAKKSEVYIYSEFLIKCVIKKFLFLIDNHIST